MSSLLTPTCSGQLLGGRLFVFTLVPHDRRREPRRSSAGRHRAVRGCNPPLTCVFPGRGSLQRTAPDPVRAAGGRGRAGVRLSALRRTPRGPRRRPGRGPGRRSRSPGPRPGSRPRWHRRPLRPWPSRGPRRPLPLRRPPVRRPWPTYSDRDSRSLSALSAERSISYSTPSRPKDTVSEASLPSRSSTRTTLTRCAMLFPVSAHNSWLIPLRAPGITSTIWARSRCAKSISNLCHS